MLGARKGAFFMASRAWRVNSTVSGDVLAPGTTSTPGIMGTGLNPCVMIDRSGRPPALRQFVDVQAAGVGPEHDLLRQLGQQFPEHAALELHVLEDDFEEHVAAAGGGHERRLVGVGRDAPARGGGKVRLGDLESLGCFFGQVDAGLDRAGQDVGIGIVAVNLVARHGALRDPAPPHHPRPNDRYLHVCAPLPVMVSFTSAGGDTCPHPDE